MDWSNLPAKGDFVPLLLNAVGYLAPRRGAQRNLRVGETLSEPITAAQSSLHGEIRTPEGNRLPPSFVPRDDGFALQYGPLDRVGMHAVSIGNEIRHVAVNGDPAEFDLNSVSESRFRSELGRPVRFFGNAESSTAANSAPQTTELGRFAFYALVALLLLEMTLAAAFGPGRERWRTPETRT
jgi:hypothetical protein